jgi:hypothetical protein
MEEERIKATDKRAEAIIKMAEERIKATEERAD